MFFVEWKRVIKIVFFSLLTIWLLNLWGHFLNWLWNLLLKIDSVLMMSSLIWYLWNQAYCYFSSCIYILFSHFYHINTVVPQRLALWKHEWFVYTWIIYIDIFITYEFYWNMDTLRFIIINIKIIWNEVVCFALTKLLGKLFLHCQINAEM